MRNHNGLRGSAPWFSMEAAPSELVIVAHLPYPKAQDVETCLHCPFSECRNCMGAKQERETGNPSGRPTMFDIEQIRRLIDDGKTNIEICKALGCTMRTAQRYKRKFAVSA